MTEDMHKERNAHRAGHGHHLKRRKREAKTQEQEEKEKGERTIHHHRGYHHKEDVPMEDRHHVHHAYHHQPGEEKIPGGWRHQHRQWANHGHLTLLGTRYNLGRAKSRARKELIDSYVFKGPASSHQTLAFTDAKRWRAPGLWMMIFGTISIAFCLVIGNFQPR
ncbi:unnamed protein product [Sphacelaria rigidula]